ncbi:transglutaminase-like domain-containing protein [Gimesia panareensis]|uniref:Protein-glutamine gamma-glutamyltransferase n=1 Tax=Gimesia panareensis TaxID=2527978 RepID=A0A518A019_9PLAN|nr:transglutaminase-like domain-containing protein [Gimesia panareensis]QDT25046.1 Protein-glutamine gamma-glutamyltransferase [Gimesia panareensis]QDU48040.1 Protein-glutamine gamma-glutamyltransferase [Gimesia panareensis]
MNAQRTIAFTMLSLECAAFSILSETLFFSFSVILLSALSYFPVLRYSFSRRQVFWITSIMAMLFIVKYVLYQHDFTLDRLAIRTPLAYAAAQFVITVQLRQLFDSHFEPFLPASFPLLGIIVFILTGDILVHGTKGLYYQVLVFGFALLTGVFFQIGHAVRVPRETERAHWPVYVIRACFFATIWLLGWLTATGMDRYERELDQLYYRLIEPRTAGLASRAGFSTISRLGSMTPHFDQGADQIRLRVKSTDEPGYFRGRAFVQFLNSEWHSEVGAHNVPIIALPPAGVHASIPDNGTWFQLGQAKSSDWIEYQVWSQDPGHVFAPLNTPLVYAFADSIQFDSQEVLTSRTMASGFPYSIFYPRHQLPQRPEPDAALQRLLQLPDQIHPEVKRLAEDVFAGCDTSAAKIQRIQAYFQNTYEYELGISVPYGEDALTYFLLEKPAAHCEYFASGTAVLLRLAGVPCRYVTGYVVRERNEYDQYWVARSRHAHAWVEAWDETRGWVTVESTPFAGQPEFITPGSTRQYWESVMGQFSRLKMAIQQGQWILAMSEAQLPLLLLAGGVVLWFLIRWVIRLVSGQLRARAEFLENPLHIQELHRLLIQMDHLLARKQVVRQPGETLMQFSRRIPDQKIAEWYQTYASSRFMPETELVHEQIDRLHLQLQEIRSQKTPA